MMTSYLLSIISWGKSFSPKIGNGSSTNLFSFFEMEEWWAIFTFLRLTRLIRPVLRLFNVAELNLMLRTRYEPLYLGRILQSFLLTCAVVAKTRSPTSIAFCRPRLTFCSLCYCVLQMLILVILHTLPQTQVLVRGDWVYYILWDMIIPIEA